MGRRIITDELQSTGIKTKRDEYFDKLIKYIPTEIVGGWIAITAFYKNACDNPKDINELWILLIIFMFITAFYIFKQTSEPSKPPAIKQTIISTISFVVWVFALGKPFDCLTIFSDPKYSSISLILYTLIISFFNPVEDKKKN